MYVIFLSFSYISGLFPILVLRIYNDFIAAKFLYGQEINKEFV